MQIILVNYPAKVYVFLKKQNFFLLELWSPYQDPLLGVVLLPSPFFHPLQGQRPRLLSWDIAVLHFENHWSNTVNNKRERSCEQFSLLSYQLSEGTATQQTIHGLKPFTTYSVGVEACTCFNCCSKGPVAQLTTQPAPPSEQPPPSVRSMTSRNASIQWDAPREPNGIVRR